MSCGIFTGILYPHINERDSPFLPAHLESPSPACRPQTQPRQAEVPDKGLLILAEEQGASARPALCPVLSPLHPGKREMLTTQFALPGAYLCFSKPVVLMLTSPWEKQPKF